MTVTSWTLSFKDAVIGKLAFDLTPETALTFFKAKGLKPTFAWQDMLAEQHASAFTVAKMMQVDMLADTQALLTDAISKGHSFQWFRENLEPMLKAKGWWGKQPMTDPLTGITADAQLGSPWRLQTIFRTNLQVAYSVGSWQEIDRQKPVAPFLMYDAVDDWRVRPEHAALDGLVLPVDDPFWNTHFPPNGWNCRCGTVQLSQEQMERFQKGKGKPPKPDKAPKIKRNPWINPRTGKIRKVPEDLDPGWDYNTGKAGLKGQQDLLAEKIAALPTALKAATEEGLALAAKAEQAAAAKAAAKAAQAALAKQEGAAALARAQAKAQSTAAQSAAQTTLDDLAKGYLPDPGNFLAIAHKQLSKADGWAGKPPVEKLADTQALAAVLKEQHAQQTILSGAKKQILLGKGLTPKQVAALDSLGDEGTGAWLAKIQPEIDQVQDFKSAFAAVNGDNPSKSELEAFLKLPKAQKATTVTQYQADAKTQQALVDEWVDLYTAENIFQPSASDLAAFKLKTKAEKAAAIAKMKADAAAEVAKADELLAGVSAPSDTELDDYEKLTLASQAWHGYEPGEGFDNWFSALSPSDIKKEIAETITELPSVTGMDSAELWKYGAKYKAANGKLPTAAEVTKLKNATPELKAQVFKILDKNIAEKGERAVVAPVAELTTDDTYKALQPLFDDAPINDTDLAWWDTLSSTEKVQHIAYLKSNLDEYDQVLAFAKAYKAANGKIPKHSELAGFAKADAATSKAVLEGLKAKATPPPALSDLDELDLAYKATWGISPSDSVAAAWTNLSPEKLKEKIDLYMHDIDLEHAFGDAAMLKTYAAAYKDINGVLPDEADIAHFLSVHAGEKGDIISSLTGKPTTTPAADDFLSDFLTPEPQAASAPAAVLDNASAIEDWTGVQLTKYGNQSGSNKGGFFTNADDGRKYYVKWPASEDIARNEVLAAKLYRLAGVEVPDLTLVNTKDGIAVASSIVDGVTQQAAKLKAGGIAGAEEHLAIDAWLANWDVVGLGYDNLLVTGNRAVRIDVGGSLRYRAQGGMKGASFGPKVSELDSLRDPSLNSNTAALFKNTTHEQLVAGVRKILKVDDDALERMVNLYGPTDNAARADLLAVLRARRADLKARFPEAAEAAQPATGPDMGTFMRPQEIAEVHNARGNGYVRRTDKGDIEDQHVLIWEEGTGKGKMTATGAQLKVRGNAAKALDKLLSGADSQPDSPVPKQTQLVTNFVTFIKGAKKNQAVREVDVLRATNTLDVYDAWRGQMAAALADGHITRESYQAAIAYWEPWIETARKVKATPVGTTHGIAWPDGNASAVDVPWNKPKASKPKDEPVKLARKDGSYELKESQNGWLIQRPGSIQFRQAGQEWEHYFEGELDGVRIRYWPDRSDISIALRGKVEILTDGTGDAAAARIEATMQRLGIDTSRPTELDASERYLSQIAFSAGAPQSAIDAAAKAATQQGRIDAPAAIVKQHTGMDVRNAPTWKPEGRDRAFGHWQPFYERPDLTGKAVEDWAKQKRFSHNVGGDVASFYKDLFNQGGVMGGKADMFRRGGDFTQHGMSPTADMRNGGGSYVYTKAPNVQNVGTGFSWSGDLVKRVDLRAHRSDPYGRIDPAQRTIVTKESIADGSINGHYEYIFKNGLSIFDNKFIVTTGNTTDRAELIAWTKKQGEPFSRGLWPDGRKLEDVIK